MAGVHRLEHVEGLGTTNFADDDAVGPHAQRVPYEIPHGDFATALDVRWPALQSDDVALAKLQLHRVFDGHDALGIGDEARQHVEQRRLAGTGTARYQDVQAGSNHSVEQFGEFVRQRAERHEVVDLERIGGKLADRQRRPVDGERRDDGIDA